MIAHNRPSLGELEAAVAAKIVQSCLVATGSETKKFEDELCEFFGLPKGHCVVVSSGSAALYLALIALRAKDKRIGVPVYSCASLRNAVSLIDGIPVYIDTENGGPNLDIFSAATKELDFLIAPSMFGIPLEVPKERSYQVIEDLSQCFGAKIGGIPIGNRGEIGFCSFYATKMITTGGHGGVVFSKNIQLIDIIRDYLDFDCRADNLARFNFKITDLQSTIGRIQLQRLDSFIASRKLIFEKYESYGLNLMKGDLPGVFYRAIITTKNPAKMIEDLAKSGISSIVPINDWELLDKSVKYPNALALSSETVSLPIYPTLSMDVVASIGSLLSV